MTDVKYQRPSIGQYVAYLCGKTLPPIFHPWVMHDLSGPKSLVRYMIRGTLPVIPIVSALLVIPGMLFVRIGMALLLFIPWVYFLAALNGVYRRHRLCQHGLDPNLLSWSKQSRIESEKARYQARFGSEIE
ncbi:MAG: DUF5313 family protein [Mycobacteriaceae bacterium]